MRGFIAIAESDRSVGEVINIGSNFEISIGEAVNMIAEVIKTDIEIETDQDRLCPDKSEVDRLWAENAKARKLTGWEPKYAGKEGFKRGLIETVQWFAVPENLKKYKADIYNNFRRRN